MADLGISPLLLPEAKKFYAQELKAGSGWSDMSLEEMRTTDAGYGSVPAGDTLQIKSMTIPGPAGDIPLRIYTPKDAGGPLPVILYIHGGGWIVGNNDTHAAGAANLAFYTSMVVVAVDYRLAPEHPYPAAVDDCWAAVEWLAQNAGDSAGGNLVAVMTLIAKAKGVTAIKSQVLISMVADLASFDTTSYKEFEHDRYVPTKDMHMMIGHYLQGADPKQPHVSPLYADDLRGLPPAFVVSAEVDVLRDEAEAYAGKLNAAGVPTKLKRYQGFFHISMMDTDLFPEQGAEFYREVGDFIRLHI